MKRARSTADTFSNAREMNTDDAPTSTTFVDARVFDDPIEAMNAGRRWCYAIPLNAYKDANGIVPSLVVEGVAGHFPMRGKDDRSAPWYWGKTRDEAERICERVNAQRGISPAEAQRILDTSIFATARRRGLTLDEIKRFV